MLKKSLLALLLSGCCALHAAESKRHVIIVSIDGFPASLWRRADLPAPNLRRLAAEGASADAMTVANPSLTWPNHTSLVTGVPARKHGLLFNGLFVPGAENKPPRVDPKAEKTAMVHAPTLYDVAFAAGLTTAESNWPATSRAPTLTWSFPEFPSREGKTEQEMMTAGLITAEQIDAMQYGQPTNLPWHDERWLAAAEFIFERHQPNLLLYHILTTDASHHAYGPGSLAGFAAIAFADQLVGDLMRRVEAAGLRDSTTFVIVTDHGFKKVSQMVYPNVLLRQGGLLKVEGTKVASFDAYVKGGGGIAFAYIPDAARKAELLPRLKEMFQKCEGIAQVIDSRDAPSLGLPLPEENAGMGDLILYPKDGYAFAESAAGDQSVAASRNYGGTHGYPANDPEMDGIFIISGAGIRKGTTLPRVRNLDVAPTAARLLKLSMPSVEGRVLTEVLTEAEEAH